MTSGKTISISIRISPRFERLLEVSTARDNCSQTNMLETLLFAHCDQHELMPAHEAPVRQSNSREAKE
jgi:hypothetical protein